MSTLENLANRIIPRLLPKSAAVALQIRRERKNLAATPPQKADTGVLLSERDAQIQSWLHSPLEGDWFAIQKQLDPIRFGTRSGAVNPGDQRALYYIARALRPNSMLEIGTHVGASTGLLALALRHNNANVPGIAPKLTTVDLLDVNDSRHGAWKRIGCDQSPAEFMRKIQCEQIVTFVTRPATDYLRHSTDKFDLIFLDGDHSASGVYQEIPAAIGLLNPGGVILLHDFFPNLAPLWADGSVVPGPQLAVDRLRREMLPVTVKPLGALPWPTKQGSSVSSLAVLCRAERLAS